MKTILYMPFLAFFAAILGAGCSTAAERQARTVGKQIPVDAGFQMFPTPRTFDGPGTVFRIANSTRYPEAELNVKTKLYDEMLANSSRERSWDISAVATFLGATKLLESAIWTNGFDSKLTSTVSFGEGKRERVPNYSDLVIALKAANIQYQKGSQYFLIVETIAVSAINVSTTNTSGFTSTLKSKLTEIVDGGVGVKWGNSQHTSLEKSFGTNRYRVFYTTERIIPDSGLSTGELTLVKPTVQPEWSREMEKQK
jgi:hypothetical protein